MTRFGLGDIVMFTCSVRDQYAESDGLGLVYAIKVKKYQVLHMTPKDNLNCIRPTRIGGEDLVDGNLQRDYYVLTDMISLIEAKSIIQKVGTINALKMDDIMRKMVHNAVERHYDITHEEDESFVPGKTYIPYAGRIYDSDEMMALVDSSLDFWLTAGRFAKQFEKEFSEFLGMKYCILTNSGSSANLLAISSLTSVQLSERRLKPGDEVITTACAFPTTVNPIVQNGLTPVFVDIDINTYNIQADEIEAALSRKTKAIFLAHTLGNPFDLDKVTSIAQRYNLWLIEDNCDALGSKYRAQYTGTFGHAATFSFYPAHHITMGEGGAVVTNDSELKRLIQSFRDWGRDCWCEPGGDNTCGKRFDWQLGTLPHGYDHKYIYTHIGYNLKITDMQAAVGLAQLAKLPKFMKARRKNWNILCEELGAYIDYLDLPQASEQCEPSWFGFPLTVREDAPFRRDELVNYLEESRIATRLLFSGNIIRHPSFENIKYRIHKRLSNTDCVMNNTFWIGVYPGLTDKMLEYIIARFRAFFVRVGLA